MNRQFIYSILQYKHSPVLREAINVGIIFYFPEETDILKFYFTNPNRVKALYPGIDISYLKLILKGIEGKTLSLSKDIYALDCMSSNFNNFLHEYLIRNDDSVLQFSEIVSSVNVFTSNNQAISQIVNIVFPFNYLERPAAKHDENYILREFKNKLSKETSSRLKPQKITIQNDIVFKFDLVWQNGTQNLVKSVGFDLQDRISIQHKTAEYCGYLNWMEDYVRVNNSRIDLLLSRPQDSKLYKIYDKSLELISDTRSNKRIVEFGGLKEYAEEVEEYVSQNIASK